MPYELRLFLVGAAAVIDTALLLSICEPSNRRRTAVPIVTLTLGVWLFHSGEFANLLLLNSVGQWAETARWLAMSMMSIGLLLMPSAMLHGVLRVMRSGFGANRQSRPTLFISYTPLICLPFVWYALALQPNRSFLVRADGWVWPYLFFTGAVNSMAVIVFLIQRAKTESRELHRFLTAMVSFLCLLTGLLCLTLLIADEHWRNSDSPLLTAVILLPVAPATLFVYFAIRYRFMRLVVERTIVYGAIVAAALLFHHLILYRIAEPFAERLRIDLAILEGIIAFLLVMMYQPTRLRVAEALRYLMGHGRSDIRQRTRELAVEMWQHLGDDPQTLTRWCVTSIKESFQLESASAWLFDDFDAPFVECGNDPSIPAEKIAQLHQALESHSHVACRGAGATNQAAGEILSELNASLAVRVAHKGVSGLLLLGRGPRGKELGDEETNSILLLVELFAVTLHNHYLQQQQIIAERRAAQNEKLSTLGLLTSCITHEIKNPLSSIRTLATLLAERSGSDGENAEELSLILEEVNRLLATTTQFLKFARPSSSDHDRCDVVSVFQGVLHVLSHLARTHNVRVEFEFANNIPQIKCPEDVLRQIGFNLVLNAIEATNRNGHVGIRIEHSSIEHFAGQIVITVDDDGMGIADNLKPQIFEPFITTKTTGTGIGLYVVRRNILELGGTIDCENRETGGTCFTIKLPLDKLRDARGPLASSD